MSFLNQKNFNDQWPWRSGVEILGCRVGLASNQQALLPVWPGPLEVPSLLTDFHEVREIAWPGDEADGYILVEEAPDEAAHYKVENNAWIFRGPFTRLSRETADRRYSFWGNQGLLYRLTLAWLEKNHGVYSLHACGLVDEAQRRLIVVAGGPGSGKTVYLLSGLLRGFRLFSTETVHFRLVASEVQWFMGSLVDNIRLGTLRHDFPSFLPPALAGSWDWSREWQAKIAVDLSAYRYSKDVLTSPDCLLILPRVEEGRAGFKSLAIEDRRQAARILFQNISEKIASSFILYDVLAVTGLETQEQAAARLKAVFNLLEHPQTHQPLEILTNPKECWGNLLESE